MKAGAGRTFALASAGALALGMVSIASAQDRLGGQTLLLTLGQSLRLSDNIDQASDPDGSTLQSRSSLDLAFDSVTRTQRLSIATGGVYEIDTDGDSDFSDPYARLDYALDSANSRLDISGTFRRVDIDDTQTTLINPIDPDTGIILPPVIETAVIEGGVRTTTTANLRYETGLRSNVGFVLDLSERARRYSQTGDPDLFDSRTRRAAGTLTFRYDSRNSARLTAAVERYDTEDADATERRERRFGVGTTLVLSPVLSFDAELSHMRIEREETGGTTVTDGASLRAELVRALRNGNVALDIASRPTLAGRTNTLRANRAMTLRRDGTLSYGLGLTKTEGVSVEPLLTLAYAQPLKRGRFSMEFTQEARTDELDDDAVILTKLAANYAMPLTTRINWSLGLAVDDISARESSGEDRRRLSLRSDLTGRINDVSSWSAGLQLSDTDTSDLAGDEDQRRYGITLGYRRQMTRDWDLVASYSHNTIEESGAADRSSNTISIGVERAFSFRP